MNKGIYQDKNGKWYIDTKINGKHCKIRGFNSKKEADSNYYYAIEKWKREHLFETCDDVFCNVFNDYIEYIKNSHASRTADREKTQYNTYWKAIFENTPIKLVYNLKNLEIIYKNLKANNNLNNRKKHDLITTFNQFTNYCYLQRLINADTLRETNIIFQQVSYTKKVETERRVITQSEIKAFLRAIPSDDKDLPMFTLFVALGCRLSEFLGICVDCYDRVLETITIKRQLTIRGNLTDKLKTANSYRKILIPHDTALLLNEYIDNCDIKKGRLFNISHTEFRRKLVKYQDLAHIEHYGSHEYRHTRCFEMAKRCENISDVVYCAKTMGHSVSIYLNTYCNHLDNKIATKFL